MEGQGPGAGVGEYDIEGQDRGRGWEYDMGAAANGGDLGTLYGGGRAYRRLRLENGYGGPKGLWGGPENVVRLRARGIFVLGLQA